MLTRLTRSCFLKSALENEHVWIDTDAIMSAEELEVKIPDRTPEEETVVSYTKLILFGGKEYDVLEPIVEIFKRTGETYTA